MLCKNHNTINLIKLPYELVKIIKSYVFYDNVLWNKILYYRENKKKLLYEINNILHYDFVNEYWGSYLRKNKFIDIKDGDDDGDNDDDEYEEEDPLDSAICYGENCLHCGNYKSISCKYTFYELHNSIICNCNDKEDKLVNNFQNIRF